MLKLDDRDIQILKILSSEGRISKTELAARVNLTPSPCLDRLKRLENAGVIKGYRAEVELAKIAPHITVFVVIELEAHQAKAFETFETAISDYDQIVACWAVGGGVDYMMQVVSRDIEQYQALIDHLLASQLGIARYFTYVVTKQIEVANNLPVDHIQKPKP